VKFNNAVLGRLPHLNLLMEFSHTEALKRAVETGIGIGCASRRTLDDALSSGSVVTCPPHFLIWSASYTCSSIVKSTAHKDWRPFWPIAVMRSTQPRKNGLGAPQNSSFPHKSG
jgi:DNA-binding transcriptional LysR family regulator